MTCLIEVKGVAVDSANDGFEAVDAVRNRVKATLEGNAPMYKVVLLDYSMPDKDGPQVAKEILQMLSELNISAPFICCCTAYSCESFKKEAMAVGMNKFLSKPIMNEDLDEILEYINK